MNDTFKGIAMALVNNVVETTKKSGREEKIVLIKHPGDKNSDSLNITLEMKLSDHTAPMYVGMIIREAAKEAGLSFEDFVNFCRTFTNLMDEVCENEREVVHKEEVKDED